jgi:integrase
MYGDGGGLWLIVGKTGARSWVFKYMIAGRSREMGLGPCPAVSLAEAREAVLKCRRQIREGIDPIDARRAARVARQIECARQMSLRDCALAYIAKQQDAWLNEKHQKQWAKTFLADNSYVPPAIGRLPVAAIDDAIVTKILLPLWKATPVTAARVRGRIENVLDWATVSKFRSSGLNPARWAGHLEHVLPKKDRARLHHHAALPFAEIAAFMVELRQQEGIAARALEFTILTACRSGEVLGARWDEIDERQKLWTVPASRTKVKLEHQVPLSDAALAILSQMRRVRQSDFVFEGARAGRPLSPAAMLRVLAALGRGGLTAHGFRSTFRDWCGDRTTFPREVAEAALGHTIGGVEGAYRRGRALDRRRQLMSAWARYCAEQAASGADIVPFDGGRRAS